VHRPVLYHEIISFLQPQRGGKFVDCTVGTGGHAWGILKASQPDGCLLGLDVDPAAIELAREHLAVYGSRVILMRASYAQLAEQLAIVSWSEVQGVLLDLGVSSIQLDTARRGFSFQSDAPLDMRFNPDTPTTAADLVNQLPEDKLADLLHRYGEGRRSRQVARAIVRSRPIQTTCQLAEIVAPVATRGYQKIHPATQIFQALRIAVNNELEAIEDVLPQAISLLAKGGRLAVISFHSLEDRIIKNFFRQESRDCICPPEQPQCICGHHAVLRVITPKPVRTSQVEVTVNPRSRSARLRVAEKL
jgi:16S rRNA (cytosine1402-N4)-methyltransferase